MDRPGSYNLGDRAITAALTDAVITEGQSASGAAQAFIDRLDGMSRAKIQANFVYGSGGTSVAVLVQTSLDQGASWIDLVRFEFAQASLKKVAALVDSESADPVDVAALEIECRASTIVLGDRLRAKITSTGTYAGNTSVSVRLQAR